MKPEICMTKHDPDNGFYGDCVRACVASILELDSADVPHFFATNDPNKAHADMRHWLALKGYVPAYIVLDDKPELKEVLSYMVDHYGSREFMLFCGTNTGEHCVIGQNGKIAHDPAWIRSAEYTMLPGNLWVAILLVKL